MVGISTRIAANYQSAVREMVVAGNAHGLRELLLSGHTIGIKCSNKLHFNVAYGAIHCKPLFFLAVAIAIARKGSPPKININSGQLILITRMNYAPNGGPLQAL